MEAPERISVVAAFGMPYKMKPLRFRRGNVTHDVREITYHWTSTQGSNRIYHFAVTDGSSAYGISFDSRRLVWELEEVMNE